MNIDMTNMRDVMKSIEGIPCQLKYDPVDESWYMSELFAHLSDFALNNTYVQGSFSVFTMLCDIGIKQGLDPNMCFKFYLDQCRMYAQKHNLSMDDLMKIAEGPIHPGLCIS